MDLRIQPTDQMIVLAEDDSTIRLASSAPQVMAGAMTAAPLPRAHPERILLLGWNARGPKIVEQLDRYVASGSELQIAAHNVADDDVLHVLAFQLRSLRLGLKEVEITDRATLESLNVGVFDHVIVLADDTLDSELADTRTLVTLLHLRDMESVLGERYSIVSEMNDERNRRLAQVTKADDFVVSGKLISLLLTQLAENRHLAAVFAYLFDADGSEIYLRPADSYVRIGEWVNFSTVIEVARRRGETAIGFRTLGESHEPPAYGVRLNPPKDEQLRFDFGDRVIVLADE